MSLWFYGILRTLHQWNLKAQLPQFLLHFVQDHYVHVHLSSALSVRYPQSNEVAQGSILRVTLFTIANCGMVSMVDPSVFTLLYVDAIFCGS